MPAATRSFFPDSLEARQRTVNPPHAGSIPARGASTRRPVPSGDGRGLQNHVARVRLPHGTPEFRSYPLTVRRAGSQPTNRGSISRASATHAARTTTGSTPQSKLRSANGQAAGLSSRKRGIDTRTEHQREGDNHETPRVSAAGLWRSWQRASFGSSRSQVRNLPIRSETGSRAAPLVVPANRGPGVSPVVNTVQVSPRGPTNYCGL